MVKISVLYGHPQDPAAFEDYYANAHAQLVGKIPGLAGVDTSKVLGTPDGQQAQWYRTADLHFDSLEKLQAAFASEEGQAVVADLGNFATGGVETFICEVHGS